MIRKLLDRGLSGLKIFAAGVGAISIFRELAIDVSARDLAIALMAVAAAAIAGALSVYIARVAKSLPRTRRIFISYSWEEKDRARELRDLLEKQGAKVWFDENALQPGTDLRSSIGAAIESSNAVVALVSRDVGAHLAAELRSAMDRHVPVFAVVSGGSPPAGILGSIKNLRVLGQDGDLQRVANTVLTAR